MPIKLDKIVARRLGLVVDLKRVSGDSSRAEGKIAELSMQCNKLAGEAEAIQKHLEAAAKEMYALRRGGNESAASAAQRTVEKLKDDGLDKTRSHAQFRSELKQLSGLVDGHSTLCNGVASQATKLMDEAKHVDATPGQIREESFKIKTVREEASRMGLRLKQAAVAALGTASRSLAFG